MLHFFTFELCNVKLLHRVDASDQCNKLLVVSCVSVFFLFFLHDECTLRLPVFDVRQGVLGAPKGLTGHPVDFFPHKLSGITGVHIPTQEHEEGARAPA
jgi:hypothetical protein